MKVYEDAVCQAILKEDGAVLGHIEVTPKQEASFLSDIPEEVSTQLLYVASYASTAIYEGLGAQATNIIVDEGDSLKIHVLARNPDDGLGIIWEPVRAEPAKLQAVADKVKGQLFYVGKQELEKKEAPKERVHTEQPKSDVPPEDNYKLKQLIRKP